MYMYVAVRIQVCEFQGGGGGEEATLCWGARIEIIMWL